MSSLQGKTIVVLGGTSGIGLGVARLSLKEGATRVIVASSSQPKVDAAVASLGKGAEGATVDARDEQSLKSFFERIGSIDHLAWTSGEGLATGFPDVELASVKSVFDIRFWGAVAAAKYAKFNPGGSIVLTLGSVLVKPLKSWSLVAGAAGAVDGLTRGLAIDLAPIRVNSVAPHYVKTELWHGVPEDARNKIFDEAAAALPVKHIADADEIAEAYVFLFKCGYITGQRLDLDGGYILI